MFKRSKVNFEVQFSFNQIKHQSCIPYHRGQLIRMATAVHFHCGFIIVSEIRKSTLDMVSMATAVRMNCVYRNTWPEKSEDVDLWRIGCSLPLAVVTETKKEGRQRFVTQVSFHFMRMNPLAIIAVSLWDAAINADGGNFSNFKILQKKKD